MVKRERLAQLLLLHEADQHTLLPDLPLNLLSGAKPFAAKQTKRRFPHLDMRSEVKSVRWCSARGAPGRCCGLGRTEQRFKVVAMQPRVCSPIRRMVAVQVRKRCTKRLVSKNQLNFCYSETTSVATCSVGWLWLLPFYAAMQCLLS